MMGQSPRGYIRSFVEIGPPVTEKKIFFMIFTIYGHGGHLDHETWTVYINFRSPFLRMLQMKFGFIGPAVSEEKIFEIVDGRRRTTDDGRRTDAGAWPSYKLNLRAFGSGELKLYPLK